MIPFTQYLRPDGRTRRVTIERPPDIEALAQQCLAAGVRFEVEELTTGEASLEAVLTERDGEIESLSLQVVPNGPPVIEATDCLIREAAAQIALRMESTS